ncbi:MAG: hypothetical protein ACI902_000465 [Psychroserpens sp.]
MINSLTKNQQKMKKITFLLMAIFMTFWLLFSQTPTTVATFNVSSCPDTQSTTVAYDDAIEGVVWVEVVYDGSCFSLTTDTEGSDFDTEIGLYDATGAFIRSNDDDDDTGGITPQSLFTETGLAAGTYYVAAGVFNVAYGATDFNVTTAATTTAGV